LACSVIPKNVSRLAANYLERHGRANPLNLLTIAITPETRKGFGAAAGILGLQVLL
jgi:hypothetical protein